MLRDIIAHDHIWTAAVRWDDNSGIALDSIEKLAPYGDQKFNRVVDLKTRLTRRLHLDAFPNRIHRATAVVVLKKSLQPPGCVDEHRRFEPIESRPHCPSFRLTIEEWWTRERPKLGKETL